MFMQNGSVSVSHSPILYLLDTLLRQISPYFHSEIWKSLFVQSFQKTKVCKDVLFTGVGRDFGMRLSDLTLPLSHRVAILAYGPPEHFEVTSCQKQSL